MLCESEVTRQMLAGTVTETRITAQSPVNPERIYRHSRTFVVECDST